MTFSISNYRPLLRPKRVDLFSEVNKELDHIFNEMFNGQYFANKKSKGYPLVDVIRQNHSLILQFTVPGVKLEDINVNISDTEEGKILEVSGKLSEEYRSFGDENYHIRELSSQDFRRIIRLPDDIENNEPLAVLRNGILTLTFEIIKSQESTPQVKPVKIIQG
jgi:HSP20 family molecular chaperone IbpA